MLCGKLITCWDYLKRPCQRDAGHLEGHCNPFSTAYPLEEGRVQTTAELYEKVLNAAGLTSKRVTA